MSAVVHTLNRKLVEMEGELVRLGESVTENRTIPEGVLNVVGEDETEEETIGPRVPRRTVKYPPVPSGRAPCSDGVSGKLQFLCHERRFGTLRKFGGYLRRRPALPVVGRRHGIDADFRELDGR